MFYSITPGDDPPIVLIAGLGFPGSYWQPVIELLRAGSATITYDRPGTGAAPQRPDPKQPVPYGVLAEELEALLDEAGVTEPAVVVGHSMGSNVARVYAGRHPSRVAGLVHVEGSIPRLSLFDDGEPMIDSEGDDGSEIDLITGEVEVLTAAVMRVPALVLTRTPGWWIGPLPHPSVDELWSTYHRLLAAELGAVRLIAQDSGHHMPKDAPALVAYAIDAVTRAVRAGTSPRLDPAELAAAGGRLADPPA
jgi:pimeloyl-ACP methyl ester carboxylesterase